MAERNILYKIKPFAQGGAIADGVDIETTGGSNVQDDLDAINTALTGIQQGEISADSFDNVYTSTLASTDLNTQTHFLSFTASPNTSGSNHSSVNSLSDQNIDIDEAGYYRVTVSITVENNSAADQRLVPDIKLKRRRSGVESVQDEASGYIRATSNDQTPRAPDDLIYDLSFTDALEVDDQIRLSIEARAGSIGTTGAVTSCTVTIRKVEFSGQTAAVSDAQILRTINALPSSNPNFYYERLRSGSGLATPSATHTVSATGDGTEFDIIPTKNSVGGILADIPFENLFQGQVELQSDVDCSLEIEGRFTHFEGLASAFVTPRTLRIDLTANVPHTEELNGFNSEVAVPLGTVNLPNGSTIDITEELLAAPFPYRLTWRLKAFALGSTTTRVAANISNFRLIGNSIIFKQANRIIGPRGLAGPAGPSTTVAALASRDVLVEPSTPPSAAATAQSFTLTLPSGITSLTQYAFIEIGTSRNVDSQISYNLLSAATLVGATSSNPMYFFPTSGDAEYLGSTFSVYLSSSNTLVFRAGSNRGFLRVVRGINIGATSTPDTWNIKSQVVTADDLPETNTALPSPTNQYDAFRINNDGYLLGTAVTAGDWLLALQENADSSDISDWDIISGDRFPVSSTLFHFSSEITERTENSVRKFSLGDNVEIGYGNLTTDVQNRLNGTHGTGTVDEQRLAALESKMAALFPLTPDVTHLDEWANVIGPARTQQEVQISQGYSKIADFRDADTKYESAGVVYNAGTNVVNYTGLGTNLYRTFGFKVTAPSDQVLLWLVDGSDVIPFIDMTAAGKFRINSYRNQVGADEVVRNQTHFLTKTSGPATLAASDGNVQTFTITNFPTGATNTSRRLQIETDVFLNGVDTQAAHLLDIDLPATNTAQAKRTVDSSVFLGPLHNNRTVTVTVGYTLRVSGANLLIDLSVETAPSDVTINMANVATFLDYTATGATTRVDNFVTFTESTGDYTFTGENELLITFQPHQLNNSMAVVGAAIGATGSATTLDDIEAPIPAHTFENVRIPDTIDFRTFSPIHFLRHSDLVALLVNRNIQWCYGLARLLTVRELSITGAVDFTSPTEGGNRLVSVKIGTEAPTEAPDFIGQKFVDTANKNVYSSVGTDSTGDWIQLNS